MTKTVHPVLLCGGYGRRLWPLSRKSFNLNATNCRFINIAQLAAQKISPADIVIEPSAKNKAARNCAAALALEARPLGALMQVVASDHLNHDTASFRATVQVGAPAAEARRMVTFGIRPVRNETGYGCLDTLLQATSETHQFVGIGLTENFAVAKTYHVVVARKDRVQKVKEAIAAIETKSIPQAETLPRDYHALGWYESQVIGPLFQVKFIVAHPGAALSQQSHQHRAEHRSLVEGSAKVTVDAEAKQVGKNQAVCIPLGALQRVENSGRVPLTLIEVQTRSYLGEDDNIRCEDVYSCMQGAKG